jgi:hypothetical protein
LFTSTNIDFGISGSLTINTITFSLTLPLTLLSTPPLKPPSKPITIELITMESIEDQWTPLASTEILSTLWPNMIDAKKAVKIWILDCGES